MTTHSLLGLSDLMIAALNDAPRRLALVDYAGKAYTFMTLEALERRGFIYLPLDGDANFRWRVTALGLTLREAIEGLKV